MAMQMRLSVWGDALVLPSGSRTDVGVSQSLTADTGAELAEIRTARWGDGLHRSSH